MSYLKLLKAHVGEPNGPAREPLETPIAPLPESQVAPERPDLVARAELLITLYGPLTVDSDPHGCEVEVRLRTPTSWSRSTISVPGASSAPATALRSCSGVRCLITGGRGGAHDLAISVKPRLLISLKEDPTVALAFAEPMGTLKREGSVTLMCWCSPLPCHAGVIRERLEAELA